jgi:putative transposase
LRSVADEIDDSSCDVLESLQFETEEPMRLAILLKYAVASVIGFIKGKSATAIARMQGKERNFAGEHFWARGYAVSTVGFNEEEVRRYIRNQNGSDESGRF